MINLKNISRFAMIFSISGLFLCQSLAYEEKIKQDFYINAFQNTTILDKNQNTFQGKNNDEKRKPEYSGNPIGGGIGVIYSVQENGGNTNKILVEAQGIFSMKNKIFVDYTIPNSNEYNANLGYVGAMTNLYYYAKYNESLSYYAGLGAGVAYLMFSDIQKHNSSGAIVGYNDKWKIALAAQFKGGVSFTNASEKFTPYIGYTYRYLYGGNVSLTNKDSSTAVSSVGANFSTHNAQIGMLIPFEM